MMKYFTQEGLEKLKKELDYLKNVKRKEIAKRLKVSSSYGDLSENADYQEAREAQGFLEGRISELENLIKNATVVSDKKNIGVVQIGSVISISETDNPSEKEEFEIVGAAEANPLENKVSIESPLGKAVMNQYKGALVEVETPKGKIRYKILRVD